MATKQTVSLKLNLRCMLKTWREDTWGVTSKCEQAIGMLEMGQNQRAVSEALNTTASIINRLRRRYWETGSIRETHTGRTRVMRLVHDRFIQLQ
ncbi:hypothetical protein ABEB36_010167 [Hypothenemus hampei]|uniref:Uncharacterized protein n=1 Tax=Hypothenemus hampei TaxID=57062 RepID=A0ABD1EIR6_HYPHA